MANGNLMSTWGAMRTTRDPDDLQRLSNDYAREMGFSPDLFPKVIFDNSGDRRELGYSTPLTRASDPRGAPFVGQTSPGGFIALSPGGDPKETIQHELRHLGAYDKAMLRPDQFRSSKVNLSFLDTTHGPSENAGAGFFGGDIQKSPYYEWFLEKDAPMNPWSAIRHRK